MIIRRNMAILILLLVALAVSVLLMMGRPAICTCGIIKLWEGGVNSAGNSQHLSDWYSFSHIIHGFLFYAFTRYLFAGRLRFDTRLAIAVAIEAGWELLENSPIIIERYRTATMALGYTGDSVLNSASDLAMMAAGFLFAARAPVWVTILLAIGFEVLTLAIIRDNLTLNVLMLIWPIEAIKVWQSVS